MSRAYETADWKLGCFLEWRPKAHSEECSYCSGKGEIGGGFKSIDGPEPCPECFGSGQKTVWPKESEKPEIPAELREHLRRAWFDFVNRKEGA